MAMPARPFELGAVRLHRVRVQPTNGNTGGAEITDWAFGLTRRDRLPKLAFEAVGKVFSENLPPRARGRLPKATVVVAAYNAASTLGECLSSIRELNYPDYETIVVDDGSTDSTSEIANQDGVRTIRVEHKGLAAARKRGASKPRSEEIVAFIDADAAPPIATWLYHLVETIKRRDAGRGRWPQFSPPIHDLLTPLRWLPRPDCRARCVPGDDRLAQLCGCNMAITKAALLKVGGFESDVYHPLATTWIFHGVSPRRMKRSHTLLEPL